MKEYYLALYKAPGNWHDKAIRFWTRSPYSHCELVQKRGEDVYQCYSASPRDGGVRSKNMPLPKDRWDLVALPWLEESQVERRFGEIHKKAYDWAGLFYRQVLNVPTVNHAYYCSEACAYLMDLPRPCKYSPGDLAELVERWQPTEKLTP